MPTFAISTTTRRPPDHDDREAFTIISGGVNVYPQEIEDALLAHPSVHDALADAALANELLQHCRQHLAGFKCPRAIHFDTDFPREPNGTLMKRQLRDRYLRAR